MSKLHHIKLTPKEAQWPRVRRDPTWGGACNATPGTLAFTFQVTSQVTVEAKDIHQALRELNQIREAGQIMIGDARIFFSERDVRQPTDVHVYDHARDKVIKRP